MIWRRLALAAAAFLVFACGGAVPAQDPSTAAEQTARADDASSPQRCERAFVWKAVNPQRPEEIVYLLGSVHMADDSFFPLDSSMEDAYAVSDKLVVEVDLSGRDEKELAMMMIAAGVSRAKTLQEAVSEETWAALTAYFEKEGMNPDTVAIFKPWFAALTLVTARLAKEGFDSSKGIDLYFLAKGDKPVMELETPEEQIALFEGMSDREQELMLLDAVSGDLLAGGDEDDLFEAWKRGDPEAMERELFTEIESNPELKPFFDKLIVERNENMARRLEKILETEDKLLVVVGAGHMVGETGLVEFFEKKGWEVEQLACRGR